LTKAKACLGLTPISPISQAPSPRSIASVDSSEYGGVHGELQL
jgi:hypothetical protein